MRMRSAQRGMVLVLVLWIVVLLTVLSASYVYSARVESTQARTLINTVRARYAAEAGLYRAAYELRATNPQTRWIGDGRPYEVRFDDAIVAIEIYDETGKLDLNGSDQITLVGYFRGMGMSEQEANALTNKIIDWRDPDEIATLPGGAEIDEYRSEGLNYGPRNRPFETINELMQVLGVGYEYFQQLQNSITIHSGMNRPAATFASAQTLRALYPESSPEQLDAFVLQRQQTPAGQSLTLPDSSVVVVQGGGLSFTVRSTATLASGSKATLEATIQLGQSSVGSRPFRVLRWRDGES